MKKNKDNKKQIVAQWYEEYYRILRKKSYDIVKDYHIANDMVNEAFMKIIKNFDKILPLKCSEQAVYFVGTVKSVSIDYIRKRKKEQERINLYYDDDYQEVEQIEDSGMTPEKFYERREFYENLGKHFAKMSDRDKELLIYKYLWEMSEREISVLLGIKEEQIHVYVKRAKARLLKIMEEEMKGV